MLLGTQYGMGEQTFAARAGITVQEARRLLRVHQALFSRFWTWAAGNQERFSVYGRLYTPMRDWFVRFHPAAKPTTLLNWPMQAGSGDILRRAVRALHRDGVCVLATLHDAVLVECDEAEAAACDTPSWAAWSRPAARPSGAGRSRRRSPSSRGRAASCSGTTRTGGRTGPNGGG